MPGSTNPVSTRGLPSINACHVPTGVAACHCLKAVQYERSPSVTHGLGGCSSGVAGAFACRNAQLGADPDNYPYTNSYLDFLYIDNVRGEGCRAFRASLFTLCTFHTLRAQDREFAVATYKFLSRPETAGSAEVTGVNAVMFRVSAGRGIALQRLDVQYFDSQATDDIEFTSQPTYPRPADPLPHRDPLRRAQSGIRCAWENGKPPKLFMHGGDPRAQARRRPTG